MARVIMVPEILQKTSLLPTHAERIAYIRTHQDNVLLRYIVQGALHPNVEWLLPTGVPPHIPGPTRDTEGILYKEIGRLYLFCKGGNTSLKQYQREKLFVDLLSILHPDDARLLCSVKEKYIPYPFLNYDFFQEAFPSWLPAREPEKILTISIPKNVEVKKPEEIPVNVQTEEPIKKNSMTEEQKAKISAANKARWAEKRALQEQESKNSKL